MFRESTFHFFLVQCLRSCRVIKLRAVHTAVPLCILRNEQHTFAWPGHTLEKRKTDHGIICSSNIEAYYPCVCVSNVNIRIRNEHKNPLWFAGMDIVS